MPIGFINKKDLTVWNKSDTIKAKNCRWMIDHEIIDYTSYFKKIKEYMWWYKKLFEYLPDPEKYEFAKDIKKYSVIFNTVEFGRIISSTRYVMVMKLLAHQIQKPNFSYHLETNLPSITEQYRKEQLTAIYPKDSIKDIIQKTEKMQGYIPTENILRNVPPMEIVEYCGIKMVKYDQLHGYYAIIIYSPNHRPFITYDENADTVETYGNFKFKKLIEDILNENINPYGNKNNILNETSNNKIKQKTKPKPKQVDISNVTSAMGYTSDTLDASDDPLNQIDIF